MTNEITSPLASIVARMAEKRVLDGRASKLRERFQACTDTVAVLCDISSSMSSMVTSSHASKFDHMKVALEDVLKTRRKIKNQIASGEIRTMTAEEESAFVASVEFGILRNTDARKKREAELAESTQRAGGVRIEYDPASRERRPLSFFAHRSDLAGNYFD